MSINEIDKQTVSFLVTSGLMTPTAFRKIEIFAEVKKLQLNHGMKKTEAVRYVSENCKMCISDVWDAMKIEKITT